MGFSSERVLSMLNYPRGFLCNLYTLVYHCDENRFEGSTPNLSCSTDNTITHSKICLAFVWRKPFISSHRGQTVTENIT
jgi:hypothetical protein